MEYVYYKDAKGNFGDDLNAWLWPKFFGPHDPGADTAFVGIGSILCHNSPLFQPLAGKRKIVFGTGVRLTYKTFSFNDTWDVRFLRGPLSAAYFNHQHEHIADAAYALGLTADFERLRHTPKKYKISVIPYFRSLDYVNWPAICRQLGFHFISPGAEKGIEHTLEEIAASELVIAEAMHGAIIADILRVPWSRFVLSTPVTEGSGVSGFKWMDWQQSVQQVRTDTTHIKLFRKSFLHGWLKNLSGNRVNAEFLVRNVLKNELMEQLRGIRHFALSEDSVLDSINNRMHEKVAELKEQINKVAYDRGTTIV
ncbi:polysaccharide pyruvyl transferase family protein [Chitinophaga alhagiae]|uniref:polysaccharide pyruvyl transferase family protein n=1 Tax=Chitinophaga alhagiae TaxID=2203219 RepID=UPI000E5A2869|nr:polysaccharide pyruvyl transferase family protein [Chitinophaga alhagiae]